MRTPEDDKEKNNANNSQNYDYGPTLDNSTEKIVKAITPEKYLKLEYELLESKKRIEKLEKEVEYLKRIINLLKISDYKGKK